MTPKNRDFHEISTFLESCQEYSGKLLGCLWSVPGPFYDSVSDAGEVDHFVEKVEKISIFFYLCM